MQLRPLLIPLLLLGAGLAGSASLHAQTAPEHVPGHQCSRERVKPERPARGREAASDSLRRAIRGAVLTDLRESTRASGVAEPAGIVLLQLDEARQLPSVHLARSNVPPQVAREVAARAFPLLATWPDRGAVTLDLRLDSIPRPEPVVGGVRLSCKPQLANRDYVQRVMQQEVATNRAVVERAGRRNTAHVRMLISRDGEVAFSEISRSAAEPLLNDMALRFVSQMQFRPASIDGVPLDTWVVLPITLSVPRQFGGGPFGNEEDRSGRQ